jgi:hypothetical protein
MRMTYSALAAVLLLSAAPSASFAQIVIPYVGDHATRVARLDHVVPVATVTPLNDALTLANPKPGADFVLGAARLDIRDPARPMIVFTVSNGTESPLPPGSVHVEVATVYANRDGEPTVSICGYGAPLSNLLNVAGLSGPANTPLQPGATVTMSMPVGPSNCVVGRPNVPLGFLVHLTGNGHPALHEYVARLRRALKTQFSQPQPQQ